ncbi:hypothetical protein BD779DRAFT_1475352 [Infundibulicybe gibba]|nr:hypothetical protein BD779DRAFT_1475352 [Infundibulicybe gibba]
MTYSPGEARARKANDGARPMAGARVYLTGERREREGRACCATDGTGRSSKRRAWRLQISGAVVGRTARRSKGRYGRRITGENQLQSQPPGVGDRWCMLGRREGGEIAAAKRVNATRLSGDFPTPGSLGAFGESGRHLRGFWGRDYMGWRRSLWYMEERCSEIGRVWLGP